MESKYMKHKRRKENMIGILFSLLAILGFICFTLGPVLASLVLGFTEYTTPSSLHLVGLENFKRMFSGQDTFFYQTLSITLYLAVMNVTVCMTTGFATAMLLDHRSMRFRPPFRVVFYISTIILYVAAAMVFMWMINPDFGLSNIILKGLGFTGNKWIYSESTILRSLLLIVLWTAGNVMVVFPAGLQGVPRQLYEAVEVDGGNSLHKFMYVTIPMMTPIVFFNGLMFLIASLQGFTPAAVITAGGPNNVTLFYTYYMYRQAFEFSNMGYASVLGWILFVVVAIITGIVFKTSKYWVSYSDEE